LPALGCRGRRYTTSTDVTSFDSSRPCDTNFMNREESPQHRRKLDLEASSDHLDRIALVLSQSGVQLSEVHAV
ncbi:MAG: hypothetical protein WD249_07980, partial [Gaiellaceae bacterium]